MATHNVEELILRKEDQAECLAFGLSPRDAIVTSIRNSTEWYLVEREEEPVAVWGYGVGNRLSGTGYPWMLSCEAAERHKVFVARASLQAVEYMQGIFPRLETRCDARYTRALNWLEWLGFRAYWPAIDGLVSFVRER